MFMSQRRRFVVSIVITAIAFAAMLVTTTVRLHHWSQIGWAGVNYFPELPARPGGRNPGSILQSGRVIVAFPHSPAVRAGITGADSVRSLNGIPIKDVKRLEALDRVTHSGDVITYRVERDKKVRDVRVRFESPLRNPRMIVSMVLSALLALSFAAIGLIVYVRRPDDRQAFVFYVMAIIGSLSYLAGVVLSFDGSNLRGITTTQSGTLAIVAAYLTIAFAFAAITLHLALIFPRDRPVMRTRPYVVRWIYVVPAFATLVFGAALVTAMTANTPARRTLEYVLGRGFPYFAAALAVAGALIVLRIVRKARVEGMQHAFLARPAQSVFAFDAILAGAAVLLDAAGLRGWSRLTFFVGIAVPLAALLVYPIITFIALYRSYREAGVEEKRQVKWPLWGTMIAVGVKILFGASGFALGILISMWRVEATTWMGIAQTLETLPRLFYLLIPISFAVAILKYRLMNIDVIIKKTVAYGILSGLIIAMYLILVGGLGTLLVNVAGVRNQTMVIASTLVVALVFVPLRNRLQNLVDRNLFRQKYDYPQALRAIAAETLAATDLRTFLVFAAETLQQAVQNRSIAIFERRHDDLVISAKVGLPDSVLGSIRIEADRAEAIDRPLNPKRRPLAEQTTAALMRVGTALAVPVRSQGVLQCVLALGSKLSDSEFDLEDIEFVTSVADQIAITIDRIRLQRDEEDFEQARAMQQALLPAHVPQINGIDVSGTWKPAGDVSGDYYDLLAVGETQLGVCIGDVAGKGMPAALLMSALQAAVRASATVDLSPAALCERVRRVIVPSLAGGRFVTFFYCTFDTAARRVRYCNAGHNPAILVRADGRTSRLDKGGPALSRLFRGTPFQEGQEELFDGDRIVLFTDGVSEARDAEGTDYGEDRLERVVAANRQVAARELVTTIVDSVSSFSAGRADDDLTLVALAITIPA